MPATVLAVKVDVSTESLAGGRSETSPGKLGADHGVEEILVELADQTAHQGLDRAGVAQPREQGQAEGVSQDVDEISVAVGYF